MPTTQQEANKVLEICQRHNLTREQMAGIFTDLNEEVGKPSENDSVKVTMQMLADGVQFLKDPMMWQHLTGGGDQAFPAPTYQEPSSPPVAAQVPVHRITEINLPSKPVVPVGACYSINDLLILLVVVGHTVYGLALLTGAVLSAIYQPWYITLLMISFIAFMMSRAGQCLCTRLENNLRNSAGYPEIDSFYEHYYFRPVWRWLSSK